ncbi:MAG: acetate kinase, partial [Pseudomonadota bacterium]
RAVEARIAEGDKRAELAIEVYTHRIRSAVGAYVAALGGLDALVFTAGVGENSVGVRTRVAKGLAGLGIAIDPTRNTSGAGNGMDVRDISAAASEASVLVIPTNEETEIAIQTVGLVSQA